MTRANDDDAAGPAGGGRTGTDQGRVSVFLAIALIAVLVIIGLVVDGAGRIRTMQRANNLAAEAARAGGQAIDIGAAVDGGAKVVDPDDARLAAERYLAQLDETGVRGTAEPSADGEHLTVTVLITYDTAMLDFLGFPANYVERGEATVELVTTSD
jgi:hypothetical protein